MLIPRPPVPRTVRATVPFQVPVIAVPSSVPPVREDAPVAAAVEPVVAVELVGVVDVRRQQ